MDFLHRGLRVRNGLVVTNHFRYLHVQRFAPHLLEGEHCLPFMQTISHPKSSLAEISEVDTGAPLTDKLDCCTRQLQIRRRKSQGRPACTPELSICITHLFTAQDQNLPCRIRPHDSLPSISLTQLTNEVQDIKVLGNSKERLPTRLLLIEAWFGEGKTQKSSWERTQL